MPDTLPELTTHANQPQATRVTVPASFTDTTTGAVYIHKDMVEVVKPWQAEAHIGPPHANEVLGDVESWAGYVKHYADVGEYAPLLTWNSAGLHAVLDYHLSLSEAGRCQWSAKAPFVASAQWSRWLTFADGRAHSQRETIEKLEDFGNDVIEPEPAKLMEIMRNLRASVNARSSAELSPDGSTFISYTNEKQVRGVSQSGDVTLPPELVIGIPVLKGHMGANGQPVGYNLRVRIRASVGDDAHLTFRFTIPKAEIVLEEVYADRVKSAKEALGKEFNLLRAAG